MQPPGEQAAATAVSLIRNGTEVPKDGSGTYFYNIFGSPPRPP